MLFRSTVEADLDHLFTPATTDPFAIVPAERYRAESELRQYRPEWTWLAEDGGRMLGRATWWGRGDGDHPQTLDSLWVDVSVRDRAGLAAELLRAAHEDFSYHGATATPDFHVQLPPRWRDDPGTVVEVDWRQRAGSAVGLTDQLERLRLAWTPDAGVPEPTERLVFTEEPDDEVFLDVLRRVLDGSLDVTSARNVAAHGVDWQAKHDLEFYAGMPGHRDWWRLARTPAGDLVGFTIPTHNPYGPVVGYLGVLPEFRGQGYIDDILAETTRIHAAVGADRIVAMTDVTNAPMAAAFGRGGYQVTDVRMVLSAPPG